MVELLLLVGGALLLAAAFRAVVKLLELLPLGQNVRNAIERFTPLVGLTLALAYATAAVAFLLTHEPQSAAILVVLVVLVLAFAWAPLYDLIGGVAFRLGGTCRAGDTVEIGDIKGRVLRIGLRAIVLHTRTGDEALIPYSRINRGALRRMQSLVGAHIHTFTISLPPGESFLDVKQRIVHAALRNHWASVVHEPKVLPEAEGRVEVSVYALDADHVPTLEAAVRRAVSDVRATTDFTAPAAPPRPHTLARETARPGTA
jgi:small-conductance mechanosensitive channel